MAGVFCFNGTGRLSCDMFRSIIPFFLLSLSGFARGTDTLISQIEAQLGVKITYDQPAADEWETVTFSYCTDSTELRNYPRMLKREYLKYPPGFFSRVGVKKIVLGRQMYYEKQNRAAVPDPYNNTLFLSINGAQGDSDSVYLIHVMHHELNHLTEYAMWQSMFYRWPDWEDVNRRFFRYDPGGGTKAYEDLSVDWYSMCHPKKGFFNRYSLMGEEEDRSEVISLIMS